MYYSVLQVTHWKYDIESIKLRNKEVPQLTESHWIDGTQRFMAKHFKVNITLPVAFIDSYYNTNNDYEAQKFQQGALKVRSFLQGLTIKYDFQTSNTQIYVGSPQVRLMKENKFMSKEMAKLNKTLVHEQALNDKLSQVLEECKSQKYNMEKNFTETMQCGEKSHPLKIMIAVGMGSATASILATIVCMLACMCCRKPQNNVSSESDDFNEDSSDDNPSDDSDSD
ncbi:MAG: hypothetical protein FJ333_10990 [Sphingomonadales bacterium]|nr:hypothetical protein [Sphingomonadales bacterium]